MYVGRLFSSRLFCCPLLILWIVSTANPQLENKTFYYLLDNALVVTYLNDPENRFYKSIQQNFEDKFYSDIKTIYTTCTQKAVVVSLREIRSVTLQRANEGSMKALDGALVTDCVIACELASRFYPMLDVAVISTGCAAVNENTLSANETIVRMKSSWGSLAKPLLLFLNHFHWNTISFVCSNKANLRIAAQSVSDFIRSSSSSSIINTKFFTVDHLSETYTSSSSNMISIINQAREFSNILVVFLTRNDHMTFLNVARSLGMLNGHYAILTINDFEETIPNEDPEDAKKLQEGLILMIPWTNRTEFRDISSIDLGFFTDAAKTLFTGVSEPNSNRFTTMKKMQKVNFTGATGLVSFKDNGERRMAYSFTNVRDGKPVEVLHYKDEGDILWNAEGIVWPGGSSVAPNDTDADESDASKRMTILKIIMGFVAGNCAALILFYFIYRQLRYRSLLKATKAWIIPWADLRFHISAFAQNRSLMSVSRASHATSHGSSESRQSLVDFSRTDETHFLATYKNSEVIVQRLDCASIDLTDRSILNEIYQTMGLSHENIVRYIGICPYQPNVAIVMTVAKRGSLQDLVMSSDRGVFTLDFMASLLLDAAKGMAYLHSTDIGSHGHLSSMKCVVDSKWTCQIAGCGFRRMKTTRKRLRPNDEHEELFYRGLLWTAPELLRIPEKMRPMYGTKEGDVYSFAIILQEVVLTKSPYPEESQQYYYKDIVAQIQKVSATPFRPALVDADCGEEWVDLIERCWNETPSKRPTFHKIIQDLESLSETQERTPAGLMEKLMARTEKHAMNLAGQVKQATADLEMERKRVYNLLHTLLPRYVADRLEKGEGVSAESFESCTMYYADIVGFTKLAASSSPMQVVELLNSLYSKYDEITDAHDTYKVETIGDCYVVASGLPMRNGKQHAIEIANLALDVLAFVKSFVVPHMKGTRLETRIGIHSGPVLAGIVGLKTPRYTVFGETTAIAERMEALGLANMIHITMMTAEILKETNLYVLERRGELEVTRGRILTTYFLLGLGDSSAPRSPKMKKKSSVAGPLFHMPPNSGVSFLTDSRRKSATKSGHSSPDRTSETNRNRKRSSVQEGAAKVAGMSATSPKIKKAADEKTAGETKPKTDARSSSGRRHTMPRTDQRSSVVNQEIRRQSAERPSQKDQERKISASAKRPSVTKRESVRKNSRPSIEK